jgi:hypothetical protein
VARKRRGKKAGPVAVRTLAAKKRGPRVGSGAANAEPHAVQRVIEFPKPAVADEVISDRIIFEIGGDRFAIRWTAEIESLPPAGPVAVEPKHAWAGSQSRLASCNKKSGLLSIFPSSDDYRERTSSTVPKTVVRDRVLRRR